MTREQLGAALWIACLQYFLAEAITISAWPGHYSLAHNYISDLGAVGCGVANSDAAICSPLHAVMNASFTLQGLLIAGGAALVAPLFRNGLSAAALWIAAAAGAGVFLVGLAPEDAAPGLHYAGAIDNLLGCNVAMATMGLALLRNGPARPFAAFSLFAGAIGLAGIACLASKAYLGLGVGGMERVVAYPFPLWLASAGLLILRRPERVGAVAAPA